ncbi:MAG TPA: hypothetical protein VHX59_05310 [Mycobacteriales bacterium]|nr:hypothetical protein [Mycobacteriales bacterium]
MSVDNSQLVRQIQAAGLPPGPRPDPQLPHRPPVLPQHLPSVDREQADAIIGWVLDNLECG